jgi:prophage regulatory protein
MRDILIRLREDAGQRTLGVLIQEREAAALEIEQLREQLRHRSTAAVPTPDPQPTIAVRHRDRSEKSRSLHPQALLRLDVVCNLVGISRSTIYRRVAEGSFPRPIRISERSVRWRLENLEEWIRNPIKGA